MALVSSGDLSLRSTCNGLLPLLCYPALVLKVPHSIKNGAVVDSIKGSLLGDKRRALTYA